MTYNKTRRHQTDYERDLNASIRILRKAHNDNNRRLRILYNYLHSPRNNTGVSLASFLQARAHIPQSEYPNEATMAKNAIAEILEIQSKMPGLKKDYDRLLSHRGVLRAGVEYDKMNRELERQMAHSSNCEYGEHNCLLDTNPAEETTLQDIIPAEAYGDNTKPGEEATLQAMLTAEAHGDNTEFAAMPGLFDDPLAASAEQPQEPNVVRTAADWGMAMMEKTEPKVDWGPNRVQSHNPGESAFMVDEFTHENVGDSMDLETMQRLLETFPDEGAGMTALLNA
ncbi:uncharacterized protein H6S33_011090 [Morchella sextelata]|jgi:hypothetical protein|uniref:uncharacterized protein n=1 Tax=Morchella sextelata TaxID=1174677 RepID=UPI001D052F0C|nr:uncharacterized protein H6S33_011090 [Morchella sextelata]KAH0611825.1 hypothetical protein H6S33_011090 [Morchella sextelata]